MARDKSRRNLSGKCLNCGTPLKSEENFCPTCGQRNTRIKIPFYYLLADFFRDLFAFDSKLFRSIVPLLFQPGKLSADFANGMRARYIPPARLYVFTSLIYFFALSQLIADFSVFTKNTKTFEQELKSLPDSSKTNATASEKLNFLKGILDGMESDVTLVEDSIETNGDSSGVVNDNPISIEADDPETEAVIVNTLNNLLNKPKLLKERVLKNASFMMLLMLPIFALILSLFYIRRKRYFIEHFVFSVHFHTFAFIAILALWLVSRYLITVPVWFFSLVLFIYLVFALKRFYIQGYLKSTFKSVLIGITYSFFLILGIAVTFILSVIFM